MPTRDEAALVMEMAHELGGKQPLEVTFVPTTVFQIAGLLQLALRHPGTPTGARGAAERFLAGAREYFADCPAVLDVLRRGDDPAEDRPR